MRLSKNIFLLAAGFVTLAVLATQARAVPYQIHLQGVLLDDVGGPLNGPLPVTVRIYADGVGNTIVWEEVRILTLEDGVFDMLLPEDPAGFPFDESVFGFGEPRWLGLEPDTMPELPLTPIVSVPYALHAGTAAAAYGVACTGCVSESAIDPPVMASLRAYDNTSSGLAATTTQDAIDELAALLGALATVATTGSFADLVGVPDGLSDGDDDTQYSAAADGGLLLDGTVFKADFLPPGEAAGTGSYVARSDHHHDGRYQPRYVRTVVVSPVGTPTENGSALISALQGITATETEPYLLKIEPGKYELQTFGLSMKQYVDIEGSGQNVTLIEGTCGTSDTSGIIRTQPNTELRELTVRSRGRTTTYLDYSAAISIRDGGARVRNVTAIGTGDDLNVGIVVGFGGAWTEPAILDHVTAVAEPGMYAIAVRLWYAGHLEIRDSILEASGGTTDTHGIHAAHGDGADWFINIRNSQIIASEATIVTDNNFEFRIAMSQLSGGAVAIPGEGTLICAAIYDENFVFYPSTCFF